MENAAAEHFKIAGVEFAWPVGLALDLGNVLMILVTTIAVTVAIITLVREKRRDRDLQIRHQEEDRNAKNLEMEASAKKLYMDYMLLAFHNPKLSIARYDRSDEVQRSKYDSYLSIVFWTLDEYLQTENDKYCEYVVEGEVETHHEFVREWLSEKVEEKGYRAGYSRKFLKILDRTISRLDTESETDKDPLLNQQLTIDAVT